MAKSVLQQICDDKQARVDARKTACPMVQLQARLADEGQGESLAVRDFLGALRAQSRLGKPALIAEIKKASPSQGLIRADFDPVALAQIYERSGAACLSILTEEQYFQGHDDYLKAARAAVSLPVLRKDFMVDAYQIYESRLLGADCVLLIMAALDDSQAADFHALAVALGMSVLVEVHDGAELARALDLQGVHLVGVNNRNLKTLDVDLRTSLDLAPLMPDSVFWVSESGLSSSDDIEKLMQFGYSGFLIGEHFMRQDDVGQAVCSLIGL